MSQTKLSETEAKKNPAAASFVNGSPADETTAQTGGIDWAAMKLPQNFGDHLLARRVAVSVAVEKPDRQSWIYINPSPQWRCPMGLLVDKANKRSYAVAPAVVPELADDLVPKMLVAYCTRQGSFGLWPIRLPDETGRIDSYNETAMALVSTYAGRWIRVLLDQKQGVYYALVTDDPNLQEPKWPEGGLTGLLDLAFRGRIISSLDHPAVVALRRVEV